LKIQNAKRGLFSKKILFFFQSVFKVLSEFMLKIPNTKRGLFYKNFLFFLKFLLSAFGVSVENSKCKEGRDSSQKKIFFS
jgi:hypothetical protein